jgi:hypothetical protein
MFSYLCQIRNRSGKFITRVKIWQEMKNKVIGISPSAGFKLKESGINHWNDPNSEATNESGFTALPGGLRGNITFFGTSLGYGYSYIGRDGIW